jgi:hypothetical protein
MTRAREIANIIEGFKLGSLGAGTTKFVEPEIREKPLAKVSKFTEDTDSSPESTETRSASWFEEYADGRKSVCQLKVLLVYNPFRSKQKFEEGYWAVNLFIGFERRRHGGSPDNYEYFKKFDKDKEKAEDLYESLLLGIKKHGTLSLGLGPETFGKPGSLPSDWDSMRKL